MRCAALIVSLLCVSPLCALPAVAQDGELAGPFWGEGPDDNGAAGTKDAGAIPTTAQPVSSPLAPAAGSTLSRIKGRTYLGLLQPDLIDLYEISITTPASFLANTQGTNFDTAIFLFRKVVGSDGVAEARAVAMNDNSPSGDVTSSNQTGRLQHSGPDRGHVLHRRHQERRHAHRLEEPRQRSAPLVHL
jgi:hypothetical protein